jgi:hypothetical protein
MDRYDRPDAARDDNIGLLPCWQCGTIIYPRHEAKQEAKLTSLTEPGDNPFKFGKVNVESVGESYKFDRTGRNQRKRKFKDLPHPDILDTLLEGHPQE